MHLFGCVSLLLVSVLLVLSSLLLYALLCLLFVGVRWCCRRYYRYTSIWLEVFVVAFVAVGPYLPGTLYVLHNNRDGVRIISTVPGTVTM